MWSGDDAPQFAHHLAALLHDGVEVVFELLDEGGVVVAYLFDDEGEGAPCLVDAHAAGCHLGGDVAAQVIDVFGLGLDFLCGSDGVEIAVDEGLALMQVALIEDVLVCDHVVAWLHFFKLLGVHACYGCAHAAYVHDKAAVAVDADDVAFESGKVACGDAELDVVARIIMEGVKEEADALWRDLADAHEGLHL